MQRATTVTRAAGVCAGLLLTVACLAWPLAGTLLAALVVIALAPLGRSLPLRVGMVLLLWMSASQFLYLADWPAPFPPRQAVAWLLAALIVLGYRVVRTGQRNAAPLLPELDAPALGLAAFVAIVAWWYLPWRGDADHVLDRMLLGWDHSGHFAMVEQLRSPAAAAASAFGGYPRGYHALVASLMELGSGRPVGLDSELVAYTYGCLAVMGASLVVMAAFVLAAPVFRRRPALLVPAVAALVTVYLQLEDASQVPYYGFGNFLEAAGLAGAAMLLPLGWTRRQDAWRWFLLGWAAAGIVGTWPVLLIFLVPVPLSVWLARRSNEAHLLGRLASTAPWAVAPPLMAALAQPPAVAGLTRPTETVTLWQALDRFLLLDGALRTSSTSWPIVFALTAVATPLALGLLARRRTGRAIIPAAALWPAPAVALLASAVILGYEVARVGSYRYYGLKVLCATTLAATGVAVSACATLVAPLRRARWYAPAVGAATIVLLCCAGTPVPVGLPVSPGGAVRADLASSGPEQRIGLSRAIRASCTAIEGKPGEYYLLLPGENHEDLVRANVWLISCGLDWGSPDHAPVLRQLLPDRLEDGARTIVDVPVDTRRILRARPDARVIVPASELPSARSLLTFDLLGRVVGY